MGVNDRVIVAQDLAAQGPRAIRPTTGHTGTIEHIATTGTFAGRIKVNLDHTGPAWYRPEELEAL